MKTIKIELTEQEAEQAKQSLGSELGIWDGIAHSYGACNDDGHKEGAIRAINNLDSTIRKIEKALKD